MIDLKLNNPLLGMKTSSGNRRVKTFVLDLIGKHEDGEVLWESVVTNMVRLARKPKYAEATGPSVVAAVLECLRGANITVVDAPDAPPTAGPAPEAGVPQGQVADAPIVPIDPLNLAADAATEPKEMSWVPGIVYPDAHEKKEARPLEERAEADLAFLRRWVGTRPLVRLVSKDSWSYGRSSTKFGEDSLRELVARGLARFDGDPTKPGCLMYLKTEEV